MLVLSPEVLMRTIGWQFSKTLSCHDDPNVVIGCENIDFIEDVTEIKQIPGYKRKKAIKN
jgi:hypothetical protein